MWLLPISMLVTTTVLAIPLSRYLAWIMDGKYHPPAVPALVRGAPGQRPAELEAVHGLAAGLQHRAVRVRLHGAGAPAVDAAEPARARACWPRPRSFNTVVSFMTNTDLQHYSGDQHFSNFSQIFFCHCQLLPVGLDRLLRV